MSGQCRQWPGFSTFVHVWLVSSAGSWAIACLFALLLMRNTLESGLIAPSILLILALVPILGITLGVEVVLLVVGTRIWRDRPAISKRVVALGTLPLTCAVLLVITWLAGGPDAFVPRL